MSIQSRDFKGVNPESLCQALSHHLPTPDPHAPFTFHNFIVTTNTSELLLGLFPTSVDTAERILTHAFTHAIDTVAPLRKLILSSRSKPWVNPQIRALMRSRDRAYRLARASGTLANHDHFRALRADTINALNSAKNWYVASRLADAPSANAKWLELRCLRVTKPSLPCPLDRFSVQALNAHYVATVSRHLPTTDHDFEAIIHQHPTPSLNTPFCLCPFSSREVTEALQRATPKSTGHDGLSVPMLKLIAPHSLTHITNLLNTSVGSATFPANWKRAIIKPLAKTKAMIQPSVTQPIAQLSELSKVLERLIHNQLQGYFEANHQHSPTKSVSAIGTAPRKDFLESLTTSVKPLTKACSFSLFCSTFPGLLIQYPMLFF